MGLGYTIDTPVKVAHLGISSTMSVIEDEMIEQLRKYYHEERGEEYLPISKKNVDHRALRVTAYLNLVAKMVSENVERTKAQPFEPGSDIVRYFELLPDECKAKDLYNRMLREEYPEEKHRLQELLRKKIVPGNANVNIMAKTDRDNYDEDGELLPDIYSDAMACLRGFARSNLNSSLVLSAGYNPRLYSYIESFPDFFPDQDGNLAKKIVLKVSDYRSALIQGKLLAKKGIWVSGFKIESGLNCGGHAFATTGFLLGPILEEFKENKRFIVNELLEMCNKALVEKGMFPFSSQPDFTITVQGGIGNDREDIFLREYYKVDRTGWGSPFLMVPEVTNVDDETLSDLKNANPDDYYLSNASPLGIPLNNFRKASSHKQRMERINKDRPGSPCYKKFLSFNTEFTDKPICTASRQYQNLKLKQLEILNLNEREFNESAEEVMEKECLCEGLGSSALLTKDVTPIHKLKAVSICPGPNLAYFSGVFTLKEMVDHIYGRINLRNQVKRPHMFLNELALYISYFEKEVKAKKEPLPKNQKYLSQFYGNLKEGIRYYGTIAHQLRTESRTGFREFLDGLDSLNKSLDVLAVGRVNT